MKRIVRVALLPIVIVVLLFLIINHTRKFPDSQIVEPQKKISLLNIKDFHYIIQQPSCRSLGLNPLVIILVHSAPGNSQKRQTIRETWASWKRKCRVVFLVGESQKHQNALEQEAHLFGDVVQGSFVDTYRNLTYKHAMALKWGSEECSEAQYVFKVNFYITVKKAAEDFKLKFTSYLDKHLIAR